MAVMGMESSFESPEELHRPILLRFYNKMCRSFPIVDKLWDRGTTCDFSKYCLDYAEYAQWDSALCSPDARCSVEDKLVLLNRAADGFKPYDTEWALVSRSWLCRCFRRTFFRWHGQDVRDSRNKIDLVEEAQNVVDYVRGNCDDGSWRPWRCATRLQADSVHRDTLRLATSGYDTHSIQQCIDWDGGMEALLGFLFRVATSKPKFALQDCWTEHLSVRAQDAAPLRVAAASRSRRTAERSRLFPTPRLGGPLGLGGCPDLRTLFFRRTK